MEDIINKISRYNIFNNLMPGLIFLIFLSFITPYDVLKYFSDNAIVLFFFSYFIGSLLSRTGSIIIEPILKKTGFVTFSKYNDYLHAKEIDQKIEDLNEENNTYRTYIALFLCLGISYCIPGILEYFSIENKIAIFWLIPILFLLFLFSYKKQTKYIHDRVLKKVNQ